MSSSVFNIALDAVKTVHFEENGQKETDIKKCMQGWKSYYRGSIMEGSLLCLCGVLINRDVAHPWVHHYTKKPQVVLLNSSECKEEGSQMDTEITQEEGSA